MELDKLNLELRVDHTRSIIEKAYDQAEHVVASTSLKDYSSVFLHILKRKNNYVKVIFVDTGYHTQETIEMAERVQEDLSIDLRVYRPQLPLNISPKNLPQLGEALTAFSYQVKVEPFERALKELKAEALITGAQNNKPGRDSLEIVRERKGGILEFRAMAHWNPKMLQMYARMYNLPINTNYIDVCTGPDSQKECGLFDKGAGI